MPNAAPAVPDVGTRDLASVRPDDLEVRIARHQFSLGVVAGSLALVLYTGTRLQRVAAVLRMHWNWCGLDGGVASYYSLRLWLMWLGLYQLNHPKTHADDWMWIVDHTMRVPRAITSDNGPDLHRGIALFRGAYPATAWLYDIKHKTACLLKHALERDASWQVFVEKVHRFKQQVSLTPLAGLAPPQQRSKARYMNVDVLVDWAKESLLRLDRPKAMRKAGLDARQVEKKLGWLRKFVPQVRRWGEMLSVNRGAEGLRHNGSGRCKMAGHPHRWLPPAAAR